MKKYEVVLIKYETYEIDAESEEEAVEIAFGIADEDYETWLEPVDEYKVKEIK